MFLRAQQIHLDVVTPTEAVLFQKGDPWRIVLPGSPHEPATPAGSVTRQQLGSARFDPGEGLQLDP